MMMSDTAKWQTEQAQIKLEEAERLKKELLKTVDGNDYLKEQVIELRYQNQMLRDPVNRPVSNRIHSFFSSCPAQVRLDVFHLSRDGGHVNTRITCDKRCRRTDAAVIRLDAPDNRPPICTAQCVFAHVENNVRYRFRPFPVFDLAGTASMTAAARQPHRRVFRGYQAFDQFPGGTDFSPDHAGLCRAIQTAQPLSGCWQWFRR